MGICSNYRGSFIKASPASLRDRFISHLRSCSCGRLPGKLEHISRLKGSWVILALDYARGSNPLAYWSELLRRTTGLVAGAKVGLPALLRVGPAGISELVQSFGDELYFLADFKLADIGDVVSEELSILKEMGFDGAIVHLFPRCLDKLPPDTLDVYGLASMTCPRSLVDEHMEELLDYASTLRLKGLVVAATKPEAIRKAREKFRHAVILSPGVGVQGAPPASALKAGADYEIVGRSVVLSEDPVRELTRIVEAQRAVKHGG